MELFSSSGFRHELSLWISFHLFFTFLPVSLVDFLFVFLPLLIFCIFCRPCDCSNLTTNFQIIVCGLLFLSPLKHLLLRVISYLSCSPLTSFLHPPLFCISRNVQVCIPRSHLDLLPPGVLSRHGVLPNICVLMTPNFITTPSRVYVFIVFLLLLEDKFHKSRDFISIHYFLLNF